MRLKAGVAASFLIHFILLFIFIKSKAPDLKLEVEPVSVNFVETMGHHAELNSQIPKSFHAPKKSLPTKMIPTTGSPLIPEHKLTVSETGIYILEVVKLLQDHKIYPKSAIDREQEGDVLVSVDVALDGTFSNLKVQNPSPFENLNQAALESVKQINRFPNPPKGSPPTLSLAIPFHYRIEHH